MCPDLRGAPAVRGPRDSASDPGLLGGCRQDRFGHCPISRYNEIPGQKLMVTTSTLPGTAGAHNNGTGSDPASLLQHLITESQNEASQGFDTKSAIEIARIINHEDAKVAGGGQEGDSRDRPGH